MAVSMATVMPSPPAEKIVIAMVQKIKLSWRGQA